MRGPRSPTSTFRGSTTSTLSLRGTVPRDDAELREQSWTATSEFGYFVLDREAAGFFLRSRKATFPGAHVRRAGIEGGRCADALSNNILVLSGEQHARLRELVQPYHAEGGGPLPARDAPLPGRAVGGRRRAAAAATS